MCGSARAPGRAGRADRFRLPDGRTICYAETGDPAGPPVFYFHGWPASRLEGALAGMLPVRLIAVDRPGFGGSTPQPGRRLLDWPADVAALAGHLGIPGFHLVGVSGGGPYAVACAALLPQVAGAALVSPVPPLAGRHALPPEVLGPALTRLRGLGRRHALGWTVIAAVRLAVRAGLVDPRNVLAAGFAERDAACVTPGLKQRIAGSWREGIRNGVAGAVSDARIYAADWGFELAAVRTPVSIWHGAADRVVPVGTLAAYAALAGQRHILEGEGHYSLPLTHAVAIVADLVGGGFAASPTSA